MYGIRATQSCADIPGAPGRRRRRRRTVVPAYPIPSGLSDMNVTLAGSGPSWSPSLNGCPPRRHIVATTAPLRGRFPPRGPFSPEPFTLPGVTAVAQKVPMDATCPVSSVLLTSRRV
ncbi:hypothetical protein Acsp03_14800 [Actinomadura sp. NBRC 104412]|nr:hypothetical protein Acsp03_14800 [Actinomadura sp. NBRC 104412]